MTTPLLSAIEGPSAWRRRDLREDQFRIDLSPGGLDEIRRAADEMRRFPLPTLLYAPAEFEMPHCAAAMARVRTILDRGVRFALVDRLPVEELGIEAATAVYWLLASMVARPVAQK